MTKDKRVKGCSNPNCAKAENKFKFKSDEHYCSTCGSELVFVCAKCHGPLEDEGVTHKICASCEAAANDRKAKIVDGTKKVGGAVGGVASVVLAVAGRALIKK